MEFSYRISEEEYLKAFNPKFKGHVKRTIKTILFWLLILASLMLIITAIGHPGHQQTATDRSVIQKAHAPHAVTEVLEDSCLLLLIVAPWVMTSSVVTSKILRRKYRKDLTIQGIFTVSITLESISVQDSAGTYHRSGWEPYRVWYETRNLIVLISRPATSFMINLAGLSDAEQNELRGILTAALPKK